MLHRNTPSNVASKRNKPKFPRLLTRTRSTRLDESARRQKTSNPTQLREFEPSFNSDEALEEHGLRTAPLQHERDRTFRDFGGPTIRNRSADPQDHITYDGGSNSTAPDKKDPHTPLHYSGPTVFRDGAGSKLFSNFKNTSAKAADGIGKAGKGLLGRITRSNYTYAREATDEGPYVPKVINLPLVEQTRRTRIAKRLEDSKDKTEFWMPALPWRCIE